MAVSETPDTDLPFIGSKKTPSNRFVYFLTTFATLGGLLFGYDIGIVSGSLLLIQPYFGLTTIWQELIVSGTIIAAVVGAFMGGAMADWIGRKKTIMTSSVLFLLGSILMGVSPNKETLLVGRIVVGLGLGVESVSVPIYVAEAAPKATRGRLVTTNQLLITIGILISAIIAGAFSSLQDTGWRYMLALAGVFAILQLIGFFYLPESPRWLMDKGQNEAARAVLSRIRDCDDVSNELADIQRSMKEGHANVSGFRRFQAVLTTPHVRKALLIGSGLSMFAQFSGITTVIYYSGTILKMAGFPVQSAIWLVSVPFTVNFLSTFIGLWLVERLGRRPLLIMSVSGIIISLVILAVGFQLSYTFSPSISNNSTLYIDTGDTANVSIDLTCHNLYFTCEECIHDKGCGFCYEGNDAMCLPARNERTSLIGPCNSTSGNSFTWTHGYCPNEYTWISVLGMTLFVFAFAPGLGPMPWTINSEIYPLWARSTCNAITTATTWISSFTVSMTFLTLTEHMSKHGTFWMFSGITVFGLVFICVFLPETKNKTLEEMEELFMTREERVRKRKSRDTPEESLGLTKI